MASQTLEQISETNFGQNIAQDRMYHTIDTYVIGTTALYSSGKPSETSKNNFNDIGSQGSGFQTGAQNNIRRDLGDGLQERYDLSKHDGTAHINYDLLGTKKDFSAKALGDAHKIDLNLLSKDNE